MRAASVLFQFTNAYNKKDKYIGDLFTKYAMHKNKLASSLLAIIHLKILKKKLSSDLIMSACLRPP